MSKYSSYKEHQLITENWRRFLAEESEEEALPADVLNALDVLSGGSLEEGWEERVMPLPISPADLRAKASSSPETKEFWDERSPGAKVAITALANAIHGTAHGALLLKKGASIAAAQVTEYIDQNPDKVAALKTINDAIGRGTKVGAKILFKVAALVAAGALVALPAFMIYDGARGALDDTYEQVIDWESEGSSMTYDPYLDCSSGRCVPRE